MADRAALHHMTDVAKTADGSITLSFIPAAKPGKCALECSDAFYSLAIACTENGSESASASGNVLMDASGSGDVGCGTFSFNISVPQGSSPPPDPAGYSPIITGLFGSGDIGPTIAVHGIDEKVTWKWTIDEATKQPGVPEGLMDCLKANTALPEAKWTNGGANIISIFSGAAIMINYAPGKKSDKRIIFGTCVSRGALTNSHTLELVPDGKIAISTTSDSDSTTSVQIFNVSAGMVPEGKPIQQLGGMNAVHSLVWDETASTLWALGNFGDPTGKEKAPPAVNGYKYTNKKFETKGHGKALNDGNTLTTEWKGTQYDGWRDGGHDMIGVPNKRQLLMSTDLDISLFDVDTQHIETGDKVQKQILPGFAPVDKRVGSDGKSIPRSDLKSLNMDGKGNTLYIQSKWKDVVSFKANWLKDGKLQKSISPVIGRPNPLLYRSRWFADTPGWPKARLPANTWAGKP